ncbi:Ig-like domain-containing protein [Enterobacter sp. 22452]|uniref:Ig-like domain-containing protein n=1 Tax=Enterobacter TaxID=547 RepID=UPI003F853FD5
MPNQIAVTIDPVSIPDDNTTPATVSALLTSDGTTPVTTATTVNFSVTPGIGCSLSATSGTTDTTSGIASVTATCIIPGDYTITATESDDISVTGDAVLTAVPETTIILTPDPLITTLNGTVTLTVTLLDSSGNPVDGKTVDWSVDAGGLYIITSDSSSVTDAAGTATVTATCSNAGVAGIITAKVDARTSASCNVFFSSPTVPVVSILNADDDHTLNADEIKLGVQLYINDPGKGPYSSGDFVTLYWTEGADIIDSRQYPVDSTTKFPISVNISSEFNSACLYNGQYSVFYVFEDANQNTHCSQNFALTVDGVTPPATLPAPSFPEATNNTINANAAAGGTNMRISYSGMAAGDIVLASWQEYSSTGVPVSGSETSTSITVKSTDVTLRFCTFIIDQEYITAVRTSGTAQGSYTVQRSGTGNPENSATATVNVDLI